MTNRSPHVGIAFLLLMACAACAPAATPSASSVHLKVVISPFLSYSPLFLAADDGLFAAQGLDVEFVKFATDSEALPGLIAGNLDVSAGILGINQFNAISKGSDLKFVADKGYYDPAGCAANAILAQKNLVDDHKLENSSGFRGLRVNYRQGSYPAYVMDTFLQSEGANLKDMQVQNLAEPANTQALQNGAIDLAFSSEPNMSIALNSGKVAVLKRVEDITGDKQLAFVLYGPNLLKKNADAGRRFMIAYLKGVQEYNKGKIDHNLDIIVKYTGLDRNVIRQACWQPIHNDGRIDPQTVMNFQEWAVAKKLLDRPVPQEQFWDPSFITYANQASH